MRQSCWRNGTTTLYLGEDVRQVLADLPERAADCIVTSPSPFQVCGHRPAAQCGNTQAPADYAEALRSTFAVARQVLTADGTLWLHLGDHYADITAEAPSGSGNRLPLGQQPLPPGNLIGLPWKVAFTLQNDGWVLRNAIIWRHTATNTPPAQGRLASQHELIFLFAKHQHPWLSPASAVQDGGLQHSNGGYNPNRHCAIWPAPHLGTSRRGTLCPAPESARERRKRAPEGGRNTGDVWFDSRRPGRQPGSFDAAVGLARRCIAAGCRTGGTVLDPFAAGGATAVAARQLQRNSIGIAADAGSCDEIIRRLAAAGEPDLPPDGHRG